MCGVGHCLCAQFSAEAPSLPGVAAGGRGGLGGAGEYKAEWRGRQAGRSNPAVSPSFPGSAPG